MQALKCCSVLAYENTQVSTTLMNGKLNFSFQKNLDVQTWINITIIVFSYLALILMWY